MGIGIEEKESPGSVGSLIPLRGDCHLRFKFAVVNSIPILLAV
jgi:hypothetical protein